MRRKGIEMVGITVNMQLDAATAAAVASIARSLNAIATTLASNESSLAGIETVLASIAEAIESPPSPPLVSLVIGTPFALKGKIVMANFPLESDAVVAWPILAENAAGTVEAAPAGDVFTVVSSSPSLNAVIGTATFPPATTATAAVLTNALVAESDAGNGGGGFFFTVTDSSGLKSATSQLIDIVIDATPVQLAVGTAPIVVGSQAVPPAAGP